LLPTEKGIEALAQSCRSGLTYQIRLTAPRFDSWGARPTRVSWLDIRRSQPEWATRRAARRLPGSGSRGRVVDV